MVGSNTPKLDITGSTVNLDPADPTKLDVRMKVANLSSLPSATDVTGGAFVDYLTSWNFHVPGNTQAQYDSTGNVYYAYLEVNTAATSPSTATTAYDGNTCSIGTTHPKDLVYPGQHLITYRVNQAAGTIDLFVPRSDVGNPSVGSTLFSVTAHTVDQAAAAGPFDCSTRDPNGNNQDPAGQMFNVYDKSAAYTSILGTQSGDGGSCHEGDGTGHVRGTQAGTASFSMDADRCEDRDTDSVTYQDAAWHELPVHGGDRGGVQRRRLDAHGDADRHRAGQRIAHHIRRDRCRQRHDQPGLLRHHPGQRLRQQRLAARRDHHPALAGRRAAIT